MRKIEISSVINLPKSKLFSFFYALFKILKFLKCLKFFPLARHA